MAVSDNKIPTNRNQAEQSENVRRQSILYDALTPEKLELILFPTEKCNFRCCYCYENFESGRMKRCVIDGVKNLIARRAMDIDVLQIAWFGGEPLIAYDIVKEIMEFCHNLAIQHEVNFSSSVTTNGYNLISHRLVELEALGVRKYQITFDGDSEWHNKTRLRIDGSGTFEKIWSNVLVFNELRSRGTLKKSDMILRLHIHPGNIASVERLAGMIHDNLDPRFFTILVKDIGHYGGTNYTNFEIFDSADHARTNLFKRLNDVLSAYSQELTPDSHVVCYAAKANYFMIRADGSIGKCTVALQNTANIIGKLRPDGSMALDHNRLALWLHALRSMNEEDLSCPLSRLPVSDEGSDIAADLHPVVVEPSS